MTVVDSRAMRAAALFTSSDLARPVLNNVAVYADDLIAATDSYMLAVLGQPNEIPARLVKRARTVATDTTPAHVNARHIGYLHRLSGQPGPTGVLKLRNWEWELTDSRLVTPRGYDVLATIPDPTDTGTGWHAPFPKIEGILPNATPAPIGPIGLNTALISTIDKAAALLAGGGMRSLMLHGSTEAMKPVIWSYRNTIATLVVMQMPIRTMPSDIDNETWTDEVAA